MMFNLFKKHKCATFLIDENIKMSQTDLGLFPKGNVVNSTDYADKGTSDIKLINIAKKLGWVVVTKDIRMAVRSLFADVPTIYISDEFKSVSLLAVDLYGERFYPEMFEFIREKYGYEQGTGTS